MQEKLENYICAVRKVFLAKDVLISEGILNLVPLPTKDAKSLGILRRILIGVSVQPIGFVYFEVDSS